MVRSEKGFTLIEVVITVAIIAIFSTIIVGVISTTSSMMQRTSNVTKAQTSGQQIVEQIQDMVMDVNQSVYYAYGSMFHVGAEITDSSDMDSEAQLEKTLYFVKKDGVNTYLEMITWNPSTQQLLYQKVKEPYSSTGDVEVLGNHVSNFRVDLSKLETEHYIQFMLVINEGSKELSFKQTVSLRNRVEIKSPF